MSSASVVVRPSVVRRFLAIAVGTVVGLDILRIVLRFGFHVSSPMTIINVSWEGNLPTWFSTMLLAANALLLAVIAHVKIPTGGGGAVGDGRRVAPIFDTERVRWRPLAGPVGKTICHGVGTFDG